MTAGPADRAAASTRLSPRVIVVLLAGLIVLLTAAIAAEAVLGHQHQDDRIGLVLTLTLWIIAAVGLVVAWHQPRNAIGWLMLGAPAAELGVTIDVIASHAVHVLPDNQLQQVQDPAGGLAWTKNVLPEVRADLVVVVGQALEPAHLAVWPADGAR